MYKTDSNPSSSPENRHKNGDRTQLSRTRETDDKKEKHNMYLSDNIYSRPSKSSDSFSHPYDCYFSIGENCISAHYLQICGLRAFSGPLDWFVISLGTVIHCFSSSFSDIFEQVSVLPKHEKNRPDKKDHPMLWVKDTKNEIISMHDFPGNITLEESRNALIEKIQRRYDRLDSVLSVSDNAAMLSYRAITPKQAEKFLTKFSALYPKPALTLINVYTDDTLDNDVFLRNEHRFSDKLNMITYLFNNTLDTSTGKPYPPWGARDKWEKVMQEYIFSEKTLKSLMQKEISPEV